MVKIRIHRGGKIKDVPDRMAKMLTTLGKASFVTEAPAAPAPAAPPPATPEPAAVTTPADPVTETKEETAEDADGEGKPKRKYTRRDMKAED